MKTIQWMLIACRLLAVSIGLILFSSGCSDQTASSGGVTAEEAKWNAETRKAMDAASKEAAAKAPKKKR